MSQTQLSISLPPPKDSPDFDGWLAQVTQYLRDYLGLDPSLQSVVAPTLINSWVDYGGAEQTAGYWKDSYGIVHLQGTVKDGTLPETIFVLPVGFRPTNTERFSCNSNGAFAAGYIDTSGNVYAGVGSNLRFSLMNISFRAA